MPLSHDRIVEQERLVLRWLCQTESAPRHSAMASFRDYHWREPLHEVIFEVLTSFPLASAEPLRTLLPGRLTRLGFPDIPDLFQPHGLSESGVEKVIERLLAATFRPKLETRNQKLEIRNQKPSR